MGRASRQRPYSGRGFERVNDPTVTVALPSRGTQFSAGYDIFSPETVDIQPGASYDLVTGIKAYMQPDEVLLIFIRSSSGQAGLELKNKVAVIDCDYFDNPGNEGNITLMLKNTGDKTITVNKGGKIAQGIFTKHLLADGDDLNGTKASRSGGIGSTGI
ncbi:MAG: hypothetical protein C0402_05335 [Thermodesulfovibrio sp.]|nr:hypothetical protein [Thermodesulfovibrio sp.]